MSFELFILTATLLYFLVIRRYRCTVSVVRYDPVTSTPREFEQHFVVSRRGSIRRNQKWLGRRGARYFQESLYRGHGVFVSLKDLHAKFERVEPARRIDERISVTEHRMRYKEHRWNSVLFKQFQIPILRPRNENGVQAKILRAMEEADAEKKRRIQHVRQTFDRLVAKHAQKSR